MAYNVALNSFELSAIQILMEYLLLSQIYKLQSGNIHKPRSALNIGCDMDIEHRNEEFHVVYSDAAEVCPF